MGMPFAEMLRFESWNGREMDGDFFSLAMYAGLLVTVGFAALALAAVFGEPGRRRRAKLAPYESGKDLLTPSRTRFAVHFYLVAILFVLFDIETIFLIPWAVVYRELGVYGLVEVGIFVGVLTFGLVYAWKRGVLDWDSSSS